MKILTAIFLMLAASMQVIAQGGGTNPNASSPGNADGILRSIENANVTLTGSRAFYLGASFPATELGVRTNLLWSPSLLE